MPRIQRDQLKQMIDRDRDFALVEVLAPKSFEEFHLPNAVNVPVGADDFEQRIRTQVPDKRKPVVVYCSDLDCNASPKAAQRLEQMGYTEVYDYAEGKKDWKHAGMPIETRN